MMRRETQARIDRQLVTCRAVVARVVARELSRQRRHAGTAPAPRECERADARGAW